MNISLTPELEGFVTAKVQEGLYSSNSEVVRQGLRLLIERDRLMEARTADIRGRVAEGLEQALRGDLIPAKEVEKHLKARIDAGLP